MRSGPVGEVVQPLGHRASRIVRIWRYREIVGVLVNYGFVDVLDALHLTAYRAGGRRLLSAAGAPRRARSEPPADRLRADFELDLQASDEVTSTSWNARRRPEKLVEPVCWLLERQQ